MHYLCTLYTVGKPQSATKFSLSNTFYFERCQGWRGILIEASGAAVVCTITGGGWRGTKFVLTKLVRKIDQILIHHYNRVVATNKMRLTFEQQFTGRDFFFSGYADNFYISNFTEIAMKPVQHHYIIWCLSKE